MLLPIGSYFWWMQPCHSLFCLFSLWQRDLSLCLGAAINPYVLRVLFLESWLFTYLVLLCNYLLLGKFYFIIPAFSFFNFFLIRYSHWVDQEGDCKFPTSCKSAYLPSCSYQSFQKHMLLRMVVKSSRWGKYCLVYWKCNREIRQKSPFLV